MYNIYLKMHVICLCVLNKQCCLVGVGYSSAVEGGADGGAARYWQDNARQGSGHRVRHHFLQRLLVHSHLQVQRRVRKTSSSPF